MKLHHIVALGLLSAVVCVVGAVTYRPPARGISQVCTSWDGPGHCQTSRSEPTTFGYVVLVENSIVGDDFQQNCHAAPAGLDIGVRGQVLGPNYDLKTARKLPNVWVCRAARPSRPDAAPDS